MKTIWSFLRRPEARYRLVPLFLLIVLGAWAMPAAAQCDYTVTSLADSGAGSLRAAFPALAASGGSYVCFSMTQGTITLSSPLQIGLPVTITGPNTITLSGNNQVGVLDINTSATTDTVRINGLTLSNGNATYGGAVWVQRGTVFLVSTVISNNSASNGGGVYNNGTTTISQCGISNNTATTGQGGGVWNDGTMTLQDTSITGNISSVSQGGGLANNGGTVTITGGLFTSNQAVQGGAIAGQYYGSVIDSGGTLFNNNSASQDGGAIYNGGNLTVSQALFTGNVAQSTSDVISCGGALCNTSVATVTESTFTANSSNGIGGAIENEAGASLTLTNDTITANTAVVSGSGLDIEGEGLQNTYNTIIAGNAVISGATNSDCNNCVIQTGTGDLVGGTVELGPLASNGGPTQTMMPLPGGAAINGGNTQYVEDLTDQRGFSRTGPAGGVDVGAVQTHYSSISYLTQPSNAIVNQTIVPPVAVQVVETDGSTVNYPQGVPVTISLQDTQGVSVNGALTGTLTESPTTASGVTAAKFGDLAVSTAGTYQLFATTAISGNSSSADPLYHAVSSPFVIAPPTVVTLSWQPAPLTYGPMPQSELNATATVNGAPGTGTFVYTFIGSSAAITVGQVYPVGTYEVQVTYTPTGSTNQYTLGTSLQITQATPTLAWPTPAAIYTSTPLSTKQLDAAATGVTGAALPGTFTYNPAAGTTLSAGPQTLSVSFTPTDGTNYTTATAQVSIQVNSITANAVTVQDSANPITFGQSETFNVAVTGTDNQPFNGGTATVSVDGVAVGSAPVVNGIASVTAASIATGTHQVGVSYAINPSSQPITGSTTLTVNKATPVLAWATPAAIYTSTPLSPTQLNATATGVNSAALPGTFVYSPAAGTTLTAGPHTLSTTFTPTDATNYKSNTAQVTIQVNAPTAASVTVVDSANPITFGQSETFTATVTGADNQPFSGGTVTFTVDGTTVGSAAVASGTASLADATIAAGTHQIGVTYTNAGSQTLTGSTTLTVNKATPVLAWATPAAIYTSTPLSGTQLNATATGVNSAALPGTFVYSPAAGTTLTTGPHTLSTTFTPTDTTDYNTNTAQVTIQVNPPTASTVVIQESANPITFGQSETFTAVVTGSDSQPLSGGTAAFTIDGVAAGSATVANGTAAVTAASIGGGTHQVGVSYTNTSTNQTLTASATLTVNKATPVLTWATPAAIYTSTPLSGTQLNATAAGVTNVALPGTFVYNPAAGATLTAGPHTLSATFTPTDTADYSTNSAQVSIQVNTPNASTIVVQDSANPITFGQAETLTATITGTDGKPVNGGTATFTIDGVAIGSPAVVNGTASVSPSSIKAGNHQVAVSYTSGPSSPAVNGSAPLTVNKATPVLAWATPAAIYTTIPLSATQLNATAAGVNNLALPGTFVYTPAAGATLTAGPHTLVAAFTPTDTTDYNTGTVQVSIQVNTPTASTVSIQESANPITYGQSETLTALVTGSDSQPFSGGTVSFTSDGVAIGSATLSNGSASITPALLTAGTHTLGASYSNSSLTQSLTGSAKLTVNKATPVLSWPTPAAITTLTPLSAAQLDATAAGINRAALPGTFAYSFAAGTTLPAGPQVLSTMFTPSDTTNYTTATAQVTIQVGYSVINVTAVSPSTATISSSPQTVTLAGSGFTSTAVVELGSTPLATIVQSSTSVSAVIPAASLAKTGTLSLAVYDPASKLTSNVVQLTVTAPAADVTVSIPPSPTSGEQPTLTINLNSPYPSDLAGTLTLAFAPGTGGVDDPAVQFSTGGRTMAFTVPAGSTTIPQVALQTGTVAGTITVTLALTAAGVDVTPAGVSPITLVIAPAVPVITSVSFTNSNTGLITIVITGFSNTREVTQASFVFTGTGAKSLGASTVDIPVTGLFSPWYGSADSDAFGSEFTYTQNFQLSRPDDKITGASVILANSIGTSGSVDSQ